MASAIQMASQASHTGASIDSLKSDIDDQLRDLIEINRDITSYGALTSSFFAEVSDISFDNIDKAINIVENITYDTVPTRSLIDASTEPDYGHVFISPDLDIIEDKLIGLVSSAGSETLKDVSAAFISNANISSIEHAYMNFKRASLNRTTAIIERYTTQSTHANSTWLSDRKSMRESDFKRELYIALFEAAQGTARWAAKNATTIEDIHSSFTASYNSLLSSLVDANVKAYKAEVSSNIANFTAQIEKASAEIDINKMRAEGQQAELKLKVKQENARKDEYIKHYSSAMSSTLNNLDANIATSKSIALGYKATLAAHTQRYGDVVIGRQ